MNESLNLWLDGELREFSVVFKKFKRKLKKWVPLWMALSVVGMSALGFLVGYDFSYVLRVHFLIGCAIALFIALCFWIQGCTTSLQKARKGYEKGIDAFFRTEEDRAAFCRQMESGNYGKLEFLNTATDRYPCRLLIGPDYWMYFRNGGCQFFRTADIQNISGRKDTARVSYNVGNARVRQNMAVGMSLVLTYRDGSPSAKEGKEKEGCLSLENQGQFDAVMSLIRQYCPQSSQW